MGLFDWLGRARGPQADAPIDWAVTREGDQLTVETGRGKRYVISATGARFVRVVPLTGGQAHVVAQTAGWQVALSRPEGDILVGVPIPDWRNAWSLARALCERTGLPLDETTQKLFSRVGQFSPEPRSTQS